MPDINLLTRTLDVAKTLSSICRTAFQNTLTKVFTAFEDYILIHTATKSVQNLAADASTAAAPSDDDRYALFPEEVSALSHTCHLVKSRRAAEVGV